MALALTGGSNPPLQTFKNKHKGETCLILGNGPSLNNVELNDKYVTIGSNTILKKFYPTYLVIIDARVFIEFPPEHDRIFIPTPDLDMYDGIRFWHRPTSFWPSDMEAGIHYKVVMHAQMQLAYYMGFEKLLFVGMDHTLDRKEHFWGIDEGLHYPPDKEKMEHGYRELYEGMGIEMINLSPYTELDIFPKDDWKKFLLS